MRRCVKLRNNFHSPYTSILNQFPNVTRGENFVFGISPELCQFRSGFQLTVKEQGYVLFMILDSGYSYMGKVFVSVICQCNMFILL